MIIVIAAIRIKEGLSKEFEAIFRELSHKVRVSEPGNHRYELCLVSGLVDEYRIVELYEDNLAFEKHLSNPATRDLQTSLGALLAGQPSMELCQLVHPADPRAKFD